MFEYVICALFSMFGTIALLKWLDKEKLEKCDGCKYEKYEDSHYCFNCKRNCNDRFERQ